MKTFHERVTLRIEEGVAQVVLSRPEKMNALDFPMFQGISAVIDELAGKPESELRAVILSGAGRAFCAGIDTSAFAAIASEVSDLTVTTHGVANLFQQVAWGWHTLPVPVIAAVHGVALGGGLQIMLGADLRIVAPTTRLSVMEIKWGLVPDMSGIARMTTLCRDDRVRELTFTGREFSGDDAVSFGFATQANADPLAEATRLAAEIAQKNPQTIRAAKRLYNFAQDAAAPAILKREAVEQTALLAALVKSVRK